MLSLTKDGFDDKSEADSGTIDWHFCTNPLIFGTVWKHSFLNLLPSVQSLSALTSSTNNSILICT